MYNPLDRSPATADADPAVVTRDVFEMTERGITVADAIADMEPFHHGMAEMSMRCLAGTFNGHPSIDADTLRQLPAADQEQLPTLAGDSCILLYGDGARERAESQMALYRPTTSDEAKVALMRYSFNALQLATSNGPGGESGYPPENEVALRDLVRRYARGFASLYRSLNAIGHPLATNPHDLAYFSSNIDSATPLHMRPQIGSHEPSAEEHL